MDFSAAREKLLRLLGTEVSDENVLQAMSSVPRELFVPLELQHAAYEDRSLPIGQGQTVSQPYIVALMTQALGLTRVERVLEIGTGFSYQTAVLAELAAGVISVERLAPLRTAATTRLDGLGYRNVHLVAALPDTIGWPPESPYDAIITRAGGGERSRKWYI